MAEAGCLLDQEVHHKTSNQVVQKFTALDHIKEKTVENYEVFRNVHNYGDRYT